MTESKEFANIINNTIKDIIILLKEKRTFFNAYCYTEFISFDPPLPSDMSLSNEPIIMLAFENYTFENIKIKDEAIIFETSFGIQNFVSTVTLPLLSIKQITLGQELLFINTSRLSVLNEPELENSLNVFMNNPENEKFFKK